MNAPKIMRIFSRRAALLAAIAIILAGWWGSDLVHAQKFSSLASRRGEITKILRERDIPADQAKFFDDYFNRFLQQFVAPERPYDINDLPKVRSHLKIYLSTGKNGQAHDRLNELVLKKMLDILKNDKLGPHQATIQYNALLVIGDLNQDEGDGKNGKPLPGSYPHLINALRSSKESLKAAALVGLDRYAAAGAVPADKTADLTKTLLELLTQQEPPAGRSAAAHAYLRRDAAQVLASLGSPGPGDSVVKAFEAIVSDPHARTTLRCEITQFLGQLKYPPNSKVDFQQLANLIGHQTVEICQQELEAALAAKRPASRRLIMYSLYSSGLGLNGLKAAAPEGAPARDFLDKLRGQLGAVYKLTDDYSVAEENPDALDADFAQTLGDKIKNLHDLLLAKPDAQKENLTAVDSKETLSDSAKQ